MAVTETYEYPIAGGVAPTAAQVRRFSAVIAVIEATAAGDLLATVTHNMAISVADLAAGWPIVLFEPMLADFYVKLPHVLTGGKTTNAVAITMENAGGVAGDQVRVTVLRPHTRLR